MNNLYQEGHRLVILHKTAWPEIAYESENKQTHYNLQVSKELQVSYHYRTNAVPLWYQNGRATPRNLRKMQMNRTRVTLQCGSSSIVYEGMG